MRDVWIPVWFATALCAIALLAGLFSPTSQSSTTAFFCFLPMVFFHIARNTDRLARRVEHLEGLQRDADQ